MASIKRIEGRDGVSFKITVSEGRDKKYKQIRHFMTWRPDKGMTERQMMKEVQNVAYNFERDIGMGFQVENRQTFDEYAAYVVDLKERLEYAPNTISHYRRMLKKVSPFIGHMRIAEIKPQQITLMYKELQKQGYGKTRATAAPIVDFSKIPQCAEHLNEVTVRKLMNGESVSVSTAEKLAEALGRPMKELFELEKCNTLSPSSIEKINAIVSAIFIQAEKEMIVKFNPAKRATLPRVHKSESGYFQPEQIGQISSAMEDKPLKWQAIVQLLMVTGARRGEVMALKWSKVDFEARQIKVNACLSYLKEKGIYEGPTKTKNTRFITIPAETVELLRRWKREQTEMRLAYGPDWKASDYVFTAEKGGPMNPGSVNAMLNKFAEKNGLPHIHPHMFRHTAASILIAEGTDILTVSKMLGHASTTTTMNIYGHAIEEAKAKASECLADAILRRTAAR